MKDDAEMVYLLCNLMHNHWDFSMDLNKLLHEVMKVSSKQRFSILPFFWIEISLNRNCSGNIPLELCHVLFRKKLIKRPVVYLSVEIMTKSRTLWYFRQNCQIAYFKQDYPDVKEQVVTCSKLVAHMNHFLHTTKVNGHRCAVVWKIYRGELVQYLLWQTQDISLP